MNHTKVDFKSLLLGMLAMGFIFLSFSFKESPATSNPMSPRYQATAGDRGFIILDTYTGDYILDSEVNYIGKMTWIKGSFRKSFDHGKDKTGN